MPSNFSELEWIGVTIDRLLDFFKLPKFQKSFFNIISFLLQYFIIFSFTLLSILTSLYSILNNLPKSKLFVLLLVVIGKFLSRLELDSLVFFILIDGIFILFIKSICFFISSSIGERSLGVFKSMKLLILSLSISIVNLGKLLVLEYGWELVTSCKKYKPK